MPGLPCPAERIGTTPPSLILFGARRGLAHFAWREIWPEPAVRLWARLPSSISTFHVRHRDESTASPNKIVILVQLTLSPHRIEIGEAQSISKRALADSKGLHLWESVLCKFTENMARGHLKEETTAQLFQYRCHVMPANSMGDVVRQIRRDGRRGAYSSSVHIRDVGKVWRL